MPWQDGNNPWKGSQRESRRSSSDSLTEIIEIFRSFFPESPSFPSGGRKWWAILGFLPLMLWAGTGIYRVAPHQKGVVLRFGKVSRLTDPGLRYHLPFPFETVIIQDVTTVNRIESSGTARSENSENIMLTRDENILEGDYTVLWTIKDVVSYLFEAQSPEETIKAAADSVVREVIAQTPFALALTEARSVISQHVHERLQNLMDTYKIGVQIVHVELGRIEPPASVIPSYRDVQAAKSDSERLRNEALAYRYTALSKAQAHSARMINEAEAFAEKTKSLTAADTKKFRQFAAVYAKSPELLWQHIHAQIVSGVLQKAKKVLVPSAMGKDNGASLSMIMPYLVTLPSNISLQETLKDGHNKKE